MIHYWGDTESLTLFARTVAGNAEGAQTHLALVQQPVVHTNWDAAQVLISL
jgi:hypothetical protein